jgi:hypothetical protein
MGCTYHGSLAYQSSGRLSNSPCRARVCALGDEEHGDIIAAVSAAKGISSVMHQREIPGFTVDEVGGRHLTSCLSTNDESEEDPKQGYAVSRVF